MVSEEEVIPSNLPILDRANMFILVLSIRVFLLQLLVKRLEWPLRENQTERELGGFEDSEFND